MSEDRHYPLVGVMILLIIGCVIAVIVGRHEDKKGFVAPVITHSEQVITDILSENGSEIENTETFTESNETVRATETTQRETLIPATTEAYYDEVEAIERSEYIGYFRLTAYEWTGELMANGEYPYYGACASNQFPLGTVLYIEGHGTFTVCDRGGMSGDWIDIYLGDAETCNQFGVQYADVYYG